MKLEQQGFLLEYPRESGDMLKLKAKDSWTGRWNDDHYHLVNDSVDNMKRYTEVSRSVSQWLQTGESAGISMKFMSSIDVPTMYL